MIKGKTPEEIRKLFNIQNDFSPEEEAQIRKENVGTNSTCLAADPKSRVTDKVFLPIALSTGMGRGPLISSVCYVTGVRSAIKSTRTCSIRL